MNLPMNLIEPFLHQVARRPAQLAVVTPRVGVTFGELARHSAQLARELGRRGVGPGQRLLVLQPLGVELYAVLIALWRLGAVAVLPAAVPWSCWRQTLVPLGLTAVVGDWRARLATAAVPALGALPHWGASPGGRGGGLVGESWVDLDPAAPALITFTSGSTGLPKAIVRSHGFLSHQHRQVTAAMAPEPGAVELTALAVFVLANLANGVTSVLPAGLSRGPDALGPASLGRQVGRHRATRLVLPPASLARWVAAPPPGGEGIERVFTGGGPVFPDLLARLEDQWPGEVTVLYGSSEAEPIAHIATAQLGDADWRAMAQGRGLLVGAPVAEVGLRLVDDEIQVSGPGVVQGYGDPRRDRETKVVAGGVVWHRTGDAGRLDGAGRLWLLGRHSARVAGYYPFAVEAVARQLPGVAQAALVGDAQGRGWVVLQPEGGVTPRGRRAIVHSLGARFPVLGVRWLRRLPMDRRHRSKVDYPRLRKRLCGPFSGNPWAFVQGACSFPRQV